MGGKLVTLKEQAGEAPNGTQFMITTGPAPELDATNLIVGKVRHMQAGLDRRWVVAGDRVVQGSRRQHVCSIGLAYCCHWQ
jgi:cyclophilin family peptidyl-prolyl cis-trans isomerase